MVTIDIGSAARPRCRTSRVVLALVLAVVATLALSGCSLLASASAPAGLRRGVDVPSRPDGLSPTPLGARVVTTGIGSYAFLVLHGTGRPVTWDPCRPVHYVVRPDGAPEGGAALLRWAFDQISTATGLRFIDDGAIDESPDEQRPSYQPARYGDRWAPVLVAWSDPVEWPVLGDGVLGEAGPAPFAIAGKDNARFVSGQAVFNGPALDQQLRTGDDAKARAVLLHELGHLVGLGHVTDPYQVMFDTNAYPLPSYRSGDRAGLALLGAGQCYSDY